MRKATISALADRLIAAYDNATTLSPLTASTPDFDGASGYAVLAEIDRRRRRQGWTSVGRKIGFTNRTIWPKYGVFEPIWAHMWSHTVHHAREPHATLALERFVQPRIEPEVVFKLNAAPLPEQGVAEVLSCVEWMAAGFEIVQSHFPDWKFAPPDCTAAFGLHGALVVGEPQSIAHLNLDELAARLATFEVTLTCGESRIDRGIGANVLDSPAHALRHLVRIVANQPDFPRVKAGEIVTTGTVTDAWPVRPGETWTSDYGTLGIPGLTVTFV